MAIVVEKAAEVLELLERADLLLGDMALNELTPALAEAQDHVGQAASIIFEQVRDG